MIDGIRRIEENKISFGSMIYRWLKVTNRNFRVTKMCGPTHEFIKLSERIDLATNWYIELSTEIHHKEPF